MHLRMIISNKKESNSNIHTQNILWNLFSLLFIISGRPKMMNQKNFWTKFWMNNNKRCEKQFRENERKKREMDKVWLKCENEDSQNRLKNLFLANFFQVFSVMSSTLLSMSTLLSNNNNNKMIVISFKISTRKIIVKFWLYNPMIMFIDTFCFLQWFFLTR